MIQKRGSIQLILVEKINCDTNFRHEALNFLPGGRLFIS